MKEEQLAERIQKECHAAVEVILKMRPDSTVQDATNAFLFMKLAELQLQVAALEKQVSFLDSENSLNRPLI